MRIPALFIAAVLTVPAVGGPAAKAQDQPPKAPSRDGGQQPRKWWLDETYRRTLGLSPEQVSRIDRLYEEYAAVQREFWGSLRDAEREVSKLMGTEAPPEGQVVAAIERTELLRYKINERRALLLFRIRQQLSLEQHQTLEKLHDKSGSQRGRSGRDHPPPGGKSREGSQERGF